MPHARPRATETAASLLTPAAPAARAEEYAEPSPVVSRRVAPLVVWGVWAALLVFDLSLVTRFASRGVPYGDELVFCGRVAVTPAWLWEQYAEHRVPLAKLLWATVLNVTDHDFRIGCYLNVLVLAALAGALILAARSLRGGTHVADAFFPLVVLNPGQALCFVWWWCINQILAPVVAGVLLIVVTTRGRQLKPRDAVTAGLLLLLLGVSGPQGLPYILTMSVWLAAWGVAGRSSLDPARRRGGALAVVLAGLAVVLLALYFVGYQKTEFWGTDKYPELSADGLKATASHFLRILTVGLGPGANAYWQAVGPAILLLGLVSLGVLFPVWLLDARERWRALGLSAFVAAGGCVVLAVAWARSKHDSGYVQTGHYLMMSAPALCGISFVWALYGPARLRAVIRLGLAVLSAAFLWPNIQFGLQLAGQHHGMVNAFERDLRAGVPAFILAERHGGPLTGQLIQALEPALAEGWIGPILEKYWEDGCGLFRQLRPTPRFEVLSLTDAPVPQQLIWEDGVARSAGGDGSDLPSLAYTLPAARKVYAVRIHYTYETPTQSPVSFQMAWGQGTYDQAPAGAPQFRLDLDPQPGEEPITVWVNEIIDHFRIYPDVKPFAFRPRAVLLLVPAEEDDRPRWADLVEHGAAVLDNDRPGYTQRGAGWHLYEGPPPTYDGRLRYAPPGGGVGKASWEVISLPEGRYVVQATWVPWPNRTGAAHYRVYDGDRLVAEARVDQRLTPAGPSLKGAAFQELATVEVRGGRLRVELDGDADGMVIADAVRLVRMP